jgi:hypothetical protein
MASRNQTAVLERRHHVARLYLQGEQQYAIGRAVGVSQAQVSMDLAAIRGLWLASLVRDFDAKKAAELARIDLIETEAWAAWHRSQQPREVTFTEATEGGEVIEADGTRHAKAPTRKASMRREGQAGDARFLERIQKCIDQRCEILGLKAPQKTAATLPDGTALPPPIQGPDVTFFTELALLFQQLGPTHVHDARASSLPVVDA